MRLIRILAAIGLGISAYLFAMKLTGEITSVVGCGGKGGCASVLGSRWSQWFGLPVSAVSSVFYLVVLALTFKGPKSALTAAAFLLIGAALWFMGLQALVIKSFCPWCLATHLTGLATAAAIFLTTRTSFRPLLVLAPAFLILTLALGQVFGPQPDTHEMTREGEIEQRKIVAEQTTGKGRLVQFKTPDGRVMKSYRLGSVPYLGSPTATHVLVKYFDYTCASCRNMEEDLAALMTTYPEEVAVIVMPTPLNRRCNPFLKEGIRDHQHACELARLGLAAWRAQPEDFPAVHEILFQRPVLRPESARAAIEKIIPADKLTAALADPWVTRSLEANVKDYRALASRNIQMPKLLVTGTKTLHGLARSTEIFVQLMAKTLALP